MSGCNNQIKQAIHDVESPYCRLVLLVGLAGTEKTALLCGTAEQQGPAVINVNRELAVNLPELAARQEQIRTYKYMLPCIVPILSPDGGQL